MAQLVVNSNWCTCIASTLEREAANAVQEVIVQYRYCSEFQENKFCIKCNIYIVGKRCTVHFKKANVETVFSQANVANVLECKKRCQKVTKCVVSQYDMVEKMCYGIQYFD